MEARSCVMLAFLLVAVLCSAQGTSAAFRSSSSFFLLLRHPNGSAAKMANLSWPVRAANKNKRLLFVNILPVICRAAT
jgi:hypothetical protein